MIRQKIHRTIPDSRSATRAIAPAALLVGPIIATSALAQTEVSGSIRVDTTWTLDASPYHVTGDVSVVNNATLTIEPGVQVRFFDGVGLSVGDESRGGGTLRAVGDADAPIVFTGIDRRRPQPGDWIGLTLSPFSTGSVFRHVEVAYAGGAGGVDDAAVRIDGSSVGLFDTLVRDSLTNGVRATLGDDDRLGVRDLTAVRSGLTGVVVSGGSLHRLSGVVVEDNIVRGLAVADADGTQITNPVARRNGVQGQIRIASSDRVLIGTAVIEDSGADVAGPGPGIELVSTNDARIFRGSIVRNAPGIRLIGATGTTIQEVTLLGNTQGLALQRDGTRQPTASTEVIGTTFDSNTFPGDGGAISAIGAQGLRVDDSTFIYNRTTLRGRGGAISMVRSPGLFVSRSVFFANEARDGGAIHADTTSTGVSLAGLDDSTAPNRFIGNAASARGDDLFFTVRASSQGTIDATNNCWGSLDVGEVEARIYDGMDLADVAIVRIEPLLECDPLRTCPADLDRDGVLTVFDYLEFQNLFLVQDPRADIDRDGMFDLFDFLAYQVQFVAGCP